MTLVTVGRAGKRHDVGMENEKDSDAAHVDMTRIYQLAHENLTRLAPYVPDPEDHSEEARHFRMSYEARRAVLKKLAILMSDKPSGVGANIIPIGNPVLYLN